MKRRFFAYYQNKAKNVRKTESLIFLSTFISTTYFCRLILPLFNI